MSNRNNMAVDENGRPLPYSPEEVEKIVRKSLSDGQLVLLVMETPDGKLTVNVMGDPSQRTLYILDSIASAYRRALEGH